MKRPATVRFGLNNYVPLFSPLEILTCTESILSLGQTVGRYNKLKSWCALRLIGSGNVFYSNAQNGQRLIIRNSIPSSFLFLVSGSSPRLDRLLLLTSTLTSPPLCLRDLLGFLGFVGFFGFEWIPITGRWSSISLPVCITSRDFNSSFPFRHSASFSKTLRHFERKGLSFGNSWNFPCSTSNFRLVPFTNSNRKHPTLTASRS